jgi:hypothetical protein
MGGIEMWEMRSCRGIWRGRLLRILKTGQGSLIALSYIDIKVRQMTAMLPKILILTRMPPKLIFMHMTW